MRSFIALVIFALATPAQAQDSTCLTSLASRYAGETERNLDRSFALAAQRDVVLQFDEADALFGARGEASQAHDRYANQEVSYLLARIERLRGVQVLASNRRTLSAGFDRRSRTAGIVLVETESGVRVLEFTHATRARALAYAQETLRVCPVG